MKQITPFTNLTEASELLDNGGRFYNLMTKENDGIISAAELAKVAGVYVDKQAMILFYAMAISDLDGQSEQALQDTLTDDLKEACTKYFPQRLLPSEAQASGKLQASAIITGVPRHIDSKSEVTGFVVIPVMAGKVMMMVVVPMTDHYDVYEVRDEVGDDRVLVAHARGKEKLPARKVRIGGILKELKAKKDEEKGSAIFLETLYWSEVG